MSPTRLAPRGSRALLALLVALALGILWAPTASAHASLEQTDPADGAVLPKAPTEVHLTFTEDVRVTLSSVRILNGQGTRVDRGNARVDADQTRVTVGVKDNLARGTYVVAWSVVSADGHPVHGGFLFSVGEASIVNDQILSSALADRGSGTWGAAGDVARFVHLVGALLAVGGACFLVLVDDRHRQDLSRWVLWGGVAATVGTLAEIPALAAQAAGLGYRSITEPGVASQVLGDGAGLSIVLLIASMGTAWLVTRLNGPAVRRGLLAVTMVGFTASFLLTGHARTTTPRLLVVPANALHVVAAAVWTGGVAFLTMTLRRRRAEDDGASGAATVVARFSVVATVAIVGVLIAGGALAYAEVRALRALDTAYGWILVAKVAVVGLVAVGGAYNHYRLVPSITRTADEHGDTRAWGHLHRTLRLEVLGMLVILALTAVLVATQPARVAAGVGGGTAAATAELGPGTVNIVVDPARPGTAQLHVYLLDANGRPVADIESVTVELRLPAQDLGPLKPRLVKAGPGHYQVLDATFPFAGSWQISVDVRVDEFSAWRATVPIEIRR